MSAAKRVLIVDDDPVTLDLMSEMLAQLGYVTETASDGREAMTRLSDEAFDIVITDVVMQGMGGSRLAMWCQEVKPDLPVVFVSGDVRGLTHIMEEGMLALTKPVTRAALERTLSAVLDGSTGYRPRMPAFSYSGVKRTAPP